MAKNSLVRFSNAIINEAEEQKRQLLNKIQTENNRLIKEKQKELSIKKYEYIMSETEKFEERKILKLSLQDQKLRYELLNKRSQLFFVLFEKIEKNILEYVKTDSYFLKLKKDFFDATCNFIDEITVYARQSDIDFLKNSCSDTITFATAEDNILGGFSLIIPEQRLFIDYTLKTKLEEAKKDFALNSSLIIR